jgi:hypothetical protein
MKLVHNAKRRTKMNNFRKTAISVGVLFIIASVLGVLGRSLFQPILDAPDYLIKISANENQVLLGGLLSLLSAFACAGIAIGLYPVLKKHHEALALGSVGLRVMEGMLIVVGVVGLLSILTLSQESVKAGASNASLFQASGTSLIAVRAWAGKLSIIAFTLGASMYYYVLYRSKLVPRWLSGWGLLGVALSLAAVLLAISGQIVYFSTVFIVLQAPIGVQEMVMAVWLIARGFNPSAIASLSAKTATNELLSA